MVNRRRIGRGYRGRGLAHTIRIILQLAFVATAAIQRVVATVHAADLSRTCKSEKQIFRDIFWDLVDSESGSRRDLGHLESSQGAIGMCVLAQTTLDLLLQVHDFKLLGDVELAETILTHISWTSLADATLSGFPVFSTLRRLTNTVIIPGERFDEAGCKTRLSSDYHEVLRYHLEHDSDIPVVSSLEMLRTLASEGPCISGQVSALLALALSRAGAESDEAWDDVEDLINDAASVLGWRSHRDAGDPEPNRFAQLHGEWPVLDILGRIERKLSKRSQSHERLDGCLMIIYAYPNEEIKRDTREFFQRLEQFYFKALGVSHRLVVFSDPATAANIVGELEELTSATIIPAVIPPEELSRPMGSYSCKNGRDCTSGGELQIGLHRANFNHTQFWTPDYLRISRYTAGPLFAHPALDRCGPFLKLDTDFFLTAPLETDPLEDVRKEGKRLVFWQIQIQGQRQEGYMHAAVSYFTEQDIKIRNMAFYSRGRLEAKAREMNISIADVPEALKSSTVLYGCLFGGDVQLFREPAYTKFFAYMDEWKGFERAGWSNQFFLASAAAAFAYTPQVARVYISAIHQQANISIDGGYINEMLTGSSGSSFG